MVWPPSFFGSAKRKHRPDWDTYFLGIAEAVAERADCTRRKVGAVIVDTGHRMVAAGYNGAPTGQPGCLTDGACPRGKFSTEELSPASSYDTGPGACIAIHAEANALLHGDWTRYQGGTIYITDAPCDGCVKLIAGAQISRVIYPGCATLGLPSGRGGKEDPDVKWGSSRPGLPISGSHANSP